MKKLIVAFAMTCLAASPSAGHAENSSSMVANVHVIVSPRVSLKPLASTISTETIQWGAFSTDVTFRINANQDAIALSAAASPLYKGSDPANNAVTPIPLDLSRGIRIHPTHAAPHAGGSDVAAYAAETDIEGFPAMQTGYVTFESSQNGHFDQDVTLTVWWIQDDHAKTMGEYGGKVRLNSLTLPPSL